jgi:hypothetical protein
MLDHLSNLSMKSVLTKISYLLVVSLQMLHFWLIIIIVDITLLGDMNKLRSS